MVFLLTSSLQARIAELEEELEAERAIRAKVKQAKHAYGKCGDCRHSMCWLKFFNDFKVCIFLQHRIRDHNCEPYI